MTEDKPFEDPGRAFAVEGEVVLIGPHSVAVSMTPEAADGTAASLNTASGEARGQASAARNREPPPDEAEDPDPA